MFPAGISSSLECGSVTIRDDEILEGIHEFTLTVMDVGPFASIDALSSSTTVIITDDEGGLKGGRSKLIGQTLADEAIINLELGSDMSQEGGGFFVCAEITGLPTGGLGTDITVYFDVTGIGSAGKISLQNYIAVFICLIFSVRRGFFLTYS